MKYTAKEIQFLRTESKSPPRLDPPKRYFSDLILGESVPFNAFKQRFDGTVQSLDALICAVVQISPASAEETLEQARETFEGCFTSILEKTCGKNRGMWESLDDTSFALAFWDFEKEKDGIRLLSLLKDRVSEQLKTEILVGVASFPCHDFSILDTLPNALKAIDHAAFFGPGHMVAFDATSLNISGDRRFQLHQYEDALAEYQAGLAMAPKDINLLNSLGVTYGITGDIDQALECFKAASDISPKEVMVLYNIGLIYRIKEMDDKAILSLKKAHGTDPEVFEVELLLGHLLHKKGDFNQALPYLDTAIRLSPESGAPYRIKGQVLLEQDKPAEASVQFNSAVKFSPNDAPALSGYARAMALQGKNLTIALSFAQKSVEIDPVTPLLRERLQEIQELVEQARKTDKHKAIKSA